MPNFCAARSGGVFLTPATNAAYPQRICLFLLGPAPFLVASALVPLRTKRKSGWGICGSSFWCFWLSWWFLRSSGLLLVHGHSVMYLFSLYHFYFCQDRASGNIGRTRGKKNRILNWEGPFLRACFFLRFEVQKSSLFVILFCSNFHSLKALEGLPRLP